MITAADMWPDNTIPYNWYGPNSNTFANYLGQMGVSIRRNRQELLVGDAVTRTAVKYAKREPKMNKVFSLAALLAIVPSLGLPDDGTAANQAHATSALIQQFETTLYSKALLLSSDTSELRYGTSALQAPFAYLIGALDSLEKGLSTELFEHSDAVLLGAKEFRSPFRLGMVRSTACYIIVLKPKSGFDIGEHFLTSQKVTKTGMISEWSAALGEFGQREPKDSRLFATQVGASYALVCNDIEEIRTLFQELISGGGGVVHLVGFPSWSILRNNEMWCYRRYRHSDIVNRDAAGMKDVTASAQALVLLVSFERRVAEIRLFALDSSTPDQINASMKKANEAWPRLLRSTDGRSWGSTITLSSDERTLESIFDVAGLFGFAIYL